MLNNLPPGVSDAISEPVQPAPQQIGPQKVPMNISIDSGPGANGAQYVSLSIAAWTGIQAFFFTPDEARAIAKGLEQYAGTAESGLVLP